MPKVDTFGLKILFLLIPGIIALGVMKSVGPNIGQIVFATGIAAIVGFLVANLQKHSIPHRLMGKLHLTSRINEGTVKKNLNPPPVGARPPPPKAQVAPRR
jgi:hypothetical protein